MVPRTVEGQPDLQGTWANDNATPLERPVEFGGRATLTDAELATLKARSARLFNGEFGIGAELEVVAMEGWRRDMFFDATGLPWVMPSPNMPTLDTAVVYPGTVLFEGTNVSEGRGTTRPFEFVMLPSHCIPSASKRAPVPPRS